MRRLNLVILLAVLLGWVTGARAAPFAYITNGGDDVNPSTVSVIDTANNMVVATIPVGVNPNSAAVHPTGEFAYVGNGRSSTLSVIRASDNTVIATIPVGTHPQGIAIDPVGTFVYVANHRGFSVSVIDTSNNMVTTTIPMGIVDGRDVAPTGIAVHPAGTFVYVASTDPDIAGFNSFVTVINTT